MSKLRQETVFNIRHKTKSLPSIGPGIEVFVNDLQRSGKVTEPASTPRSYKVETPTSTIRRNGVHLTPLSNQQEQQQKKTEQKLLRVSLLFVFLLWAPAHLAP